MRSKHLKLHKYIGVIFGLIFTIIASTGSILVFKEEINSIFYPQIHHITPQNQSISVQSIVDIVTQKFPEEKLSYIKIPSSPQNSYKVIVKNTKSKKYIYLNPYTGEILAVITNNQIINIIHQVHINLLSGEIGKLLVGVCGILLIATAVSGLRIWAGWKRLSTGFKIRLNAPKHILNYDIHQLTGIISAAFLIFLSLTGCMMVFKKPIKTWGYAIAGMNQPRKVLSTPQNSGIQINLDYLIQQANQALPDGKPTIIIPASSRTAPVIVRKRLSGDLNKNGKSYIYLDQYSGKVLKVENILNAYFIDKILAFIYPLHIGSYGGNLIRLTYFLLGIAPLILSITGLLIFWNKTYGARYRKKSK